GWIPRRDDQAASLGSRWVGLDRVDPLDDLIDLIDRVAVSAPLAPLSTIHPAQVAALVGPLIPDMDSVVVQVLDVRRSAQKPDQFMGDRVEVDPLGCHERKTFGEVEPDLSAEHTQGVD